MRVGATLNCTTKPLLASAAATLPLLPKLLFSFWTQHKTAREMFGAVCLFFPQNRRRMRPRHLSTDSARDLHPP